VQVKEYKEIVVKDYYYRSVCEGKTKQVLGKWDNEVLLY